MDAEDREFAEQQILAVARKFWPRAVRLERVPRGRYLVVTDSGNVVAQAYLDDRTFMPWFQPTGSTEPDECGGGCK